MLNEEKDEILEKSYFNDLKQINQVHKNSWSRSFTLNQIAMKSYERSLVEPSTTETYKTDDI